MARVCDARAFSGSLAVSGCLWLSLAHCLALSSSLWLSQALSGKYQKVPPQKVLLGGPFCGGTS